jgi:2-phospho-L-lactate guanylyltransferase
MLANTLKAISNVPQIDHMLVVSRDPGALSMARDFGAKTVQEDGTSDDLNAALKRATVVAQLLGAQSILILPADLPMIDAESIQALIKMANKPPVVVIAPDRRSDGTNGMLISPAGLIEYQYGQSSFSKHVEQAERYHVRVEICQEQSLALDLDLPEDLALFQKMEIVQFDLQGAD